MSVKEIHVNCICQNSQIPFVYRLVITKNVGVFILVFLPCIILQTFKCFKICILKFTEIYVSVFTSHIKTDTECTVWKKLCSLTGTWTWVYSSTGWILYPPSYQFTYLVPIIVTKSELSHTPLRSVNSFSIFRSPELKVYQIRH